MGLAGYLRLERELGAAGIRRRRLGDVLVLAPVLAERLLGAAQQAVQRGGDGLAGRRCPLREAGQPELRQASRHLTVSLRFPTRTTGTPTDRRQLLQSSSAQLIILPVPGVDLPAPAQLPGDPRAASSRSFQRDRGQRRHRRHHLGQLAHRVLHRPLRRDLADRARHLGVQLMR